MSISYNKLKMFFVMILAFVAINCVTLMAEEQALLDYVTVERVNFRTGPSTDDAIIVTIERGTAVKVSSYVENGWSTVVYNEKTGYIFSEYIVTKEAYEAAKVSSPNSEVELLDWWSEAKGVITIGADIKVYDVRSGLTYYIRSFSNGNHADVEPITKEDTAIMKKTYGGVWSWDARPVLVTINGRTLAAAINGMPHGGGVNGNNGMSGQVCLHFKNSTTHNGNRSYEKDLQAAVMEAWAAR